MARDYPVTALRVVVEAVAEDDDDTLAVAAATQAWSADSDTLPGGNLRRMSEEPDRLGTSG